MISPFKSINITYWICILLDAGIALTLCLVYKVNPILALSFAVIWFFVIKMVFTSRSVKKINRFVAEKTRDCHIRPCIELYEKLLKQTKGSKDSIYINLSTLYLACGEFEKMDQALDSINADFKKDAKGITMAIYYYNNRAFGDLQKGNLDLAEKNLAEMKVYLDDPRAQNSQKGLALYEAKQDLLTVLRGDCGNIELDLRDKLVEQTDPSGRLLYEYILSMYHLNRGENEKARKYLDTMMEHGGDTFYVDWAKNELMKI